MTTLFPKVILIHGNGFEFEDRGHFVDSRALPEVVQYVRRKLNL